MANMLKSADLDFEYRADLNYPDETQKKFEK